MSDFKYFDRKSTRTIEVFAPNPERPDSILIRVDALHYGGDTVWIDMPVKKAKELGILLNILPCPCCNK